ncbi:hypothetical protein Aperf_G00000012009 [Anoplocephala perfoliata]
MLKILSLLRVLVPFQIAYIDRVKAARSLKQPSGGTFASFKYSYLHQSQNLTSQQAQEAEFKPQCHEVLGDGFIVSGKLYKVTLNTAKDEKKDERPTPAAAAEIPAKPAETFEHYQMLMATKKTRWLCLGSEDGPAAIKVTRLSTVILEIRLRSDL